ncbi:hypothetical protein KGQ34_02320 [Patescibacteria group bacterium]|nr:hypothetical protein [Patescibacteria group bacterium]
MNKTALQFFGFALLLVFVGAGAVWGIDYYQKIHSPEYQTELKMRELEARARADTYGGSTPEETLALFIDALKRGDIDLASKYFVVDEWEKKNIELRKGKEQGSLEKITTILEKVNYPTKYSDGSYELSIVEKDNSIKFGVHFVLNNFTNKWKILEL